MQDSSKKEDWEFLGSTINIFFRNEKFLKVGNNLCPTTCDNVKKTYALHVLHLLTSRKLAHHHYSYLCTLRVFPIVHLTKKMPGKKSVEGKEFKSNTAF